MTFDQAGDLWFDIILPAIICGILSFIIGIPVIWILHKLGWMK